MTRIEEIAEGLEKDTYKDPVHGRIAKDNFMYGVAQAKLEAVRAFRSQSIKIINTTQGGPQFRALLDSFEAALTRELGV